MRVLLRVLLCLAAVASIGAVTCTASNMAGLLADHASSSSCWTVIQRNGRQVIYDVTRLLRRHEGGRTVVEQLCGVDGSISFYCNHDVDELQESLDDGDMSIVCTVGSGRRSMVELNEELDEDNELRSGSEDDAINTCGSGGSLPPPPATPVLATDVEQHSGSSDCWTVLGNSVFDITKYLHLHPGGQSTVLTMCGRDATGPFAAQHTYHYIRQGINAGWIRELGTLSGSFTPPELPSTSSQALNAYDMPTLRTHKTRADCWVLVTEFVYDLTDFYDLHPAGGDTLQCGADNTAFFSLQHSLDYLTRLSQYLVGKIAASALADAIAPTELPQNTSGTKTVYLLSEVTPHNTAADCWVVLHCQVLDMTAFIPRHTGDKQYGAAGAIAPLCGSDASNEFDLINHPGSYVDLSLAMGGVRLGRIAGCSDLQSFLNPATNGNTVSGTAEYTISWTGIADATPYLSDGAYNVTLQTITNEITNRLAATGHNNLRVRVNSLEQGSLIANLAFEFTNYQSIDMVKAFAMHPNGLEAVPFQGQTPVIQSGPILAVTYTQRAAQPAQNISTGRITTTNPALVHKLTLLQVADHATEQDCWMAIHGQVWNCANGGWTHTGGSFFRKGLCGVDATRSFDAVHSQTYLTAAQMQKIGCTLEAMLSAEQGAKLTAQVEPTVLPGTVVQLTGGGEEPLADHSDNSNCWMAIRGNVYSAGSLLTRHDGGRRQVQALCGIDATAAFDCWHDSGDLREAQEDYNMRKVGTISGQLGRSCRWVEPPDLGSVEGYMVAEHAASADCWTVLHGVVWDLTNYVLKHTGGQTAIVGICGTDGTASFDKNHKRGYLSTLQAKGLPMIGKLASEIPPPTLGGASYPAVTSAELSRHTSRQNCWTSIHGHVLDISGFMSKHSGGASTLIPACGKDGSHVFDSGGHPQSYIAMMVNKEQAVLKGCLDEPCGGVSPGVSSPSAPSTIPSDAGTKTVTVPARKCTPSEPAPPETLLEIGSAELALHKTPKDCWIVMGCGVYDVSSYNHGGGNGLVHAWCGKDGTSSFSSKHPMSYLKVLLRQGGKLVGKAGTTTVRNEVGRSTPIALSELIKHATAGDCWSCIGGSVYDLTSFHQSHEAGSAVVLPMCGADGTLALLIAHALDVMEGIPTVGSCNMRAEKAFTEQNILDAVAFGLYVLLPFVLIAFTHRCMGVRMQDRMLRRPIAEPRGGAWGDFINSYLEMPWALVLLIILYWIITGVLYLFWILHYQEYYPKAYAVPGAAGRMAVYQICLSSYIGTRRFTWSWWLLKLPYERALKTHYIVGMVALTLSLIHGFAYLDAFSWNLPETVSGTAIPIIIALGVLAPFTFPNFRVKWYGIFRVTHYAGPFVVIMAVIHIASLNADGALARGFHVTIFWVASAAVFWVCDFIQTCWDAFANPVTLEGTPVLLPTVAGDASYLALVCRKRTTLYPGCWMSVASPAANTALSHPFTTIVRHAGGIDGEEAVMEFIWKVNPGQWTERMYRSVEGGNTKPSLIVTGPFGGGLGAFVNLEKIRAMVFVCAGVGVTPVASMMDLFSSDSRKMVHVVWSFRSMSLYEYTRPHFARLPPENCHFHFTSKDQPTSLGAGVNLGRPNLATILQQVKDRAEAVGMSDIGVFVCGPNAMVADVLRTTREINDDVSHHSYFHVHSESFQM